MTIHIAGRLFSDAGQLYARSMVPPSSASFVGGTAMSSSPSYITTDLAAAYLFNTGITITGAGVSTWADQSGNGRDLLQGTDTNRPAQQADGTVLFDGTDNYLATGAFTLAKPTTIYISAKQVTHTLNDRFYDGVNALTGALVQFNASPRIGLFAGASAPTSLLLTVDTYGAIACVFNGASSLIKVDQNTSVLGNSGAAGDMGGIIMGADGGLTLFSNIQVKEMLVYSVAHTETQVTNTNSYITNGAGGTIYIEDLAASAVPAGSVFIGGIAHNQNGRMYVTTDAPSSPMHINGQAVRQDGALHVTAAAVAGTDMFLAGWAHTQDGIARMYIS